MDDSGLAQGSTQLIAPDQGTDQDAGRGLGCQLQHFGSTIVSPIGRFDQNLSLSSAKSVANGFKSRNQPPAAPKQTKPGQETLGQQSLHQAGQIRWYGDRPFQASGKRLALDRLVQRLSGGPDPSAPPRQFFSKVRHDDAAGIRNEPDQAILRSAHGRRDAPPFRPPGLGTVIRRNIGNGRTVRRHPGRQPTLHRRTGRRQSRTRGRPAPCLRHRRVPRPLPARPTVQQIPRP